MNSNVKVALVGICGYGGNYLNVLLEPRRAADFELVGLVDPAPSHSPRLADVLNRGIPVHTDLGALWEHTPVDLTMLCTPIHLHARQTRAALAHESNVLCEKPLGATLDDALDVEAAERRYRGFVAVGFQWSFSRAVQALKRDVMAGILGRAKRLSSLVMFPRGRDYYCRNSWAGRLKTDDGEPVNDSPLNNAAAHYLHNMLYVLGATRESSAWPAEVQAELYRANEIESYDTAALRCRTTCGTEVLLYSTHATPQRRGPVCRFEFAHAVVEYDDGHGGQFVARFADGRVVNYGRPEADRKEKIWQSIEAVRTGAPVACGTSAALPHAMCVAAAQESFPRIAEFPDPLRRSGVIGGGGSEEMVWVDGLSDALSDAFERGLLPCETGRHAWARAGRRVQLAGLRAPLEQPVARSAALA